jgi:hypothetical protein
MDTGVAGARGVAAAGEGVLGGAFAAHDLPPASAEKASRRATAGMKRISEPRVDPTRITVTSGCADDATMKLP